MQLGRLERHTAYIIMLAEYEADPSGFKRKGLCYLTYCLDRFGYGMYDGDCVVMATDLPELFAKKPIHTHGVYWFNPNSADSWQKRIEILKQCIAETY